tara:strand:+ start:6059 stop:6226 length:168 start_codon:yes stop_codon:yes gene_type:complete
LERPKWRILIWELNGLGSLGTGGKHGIADENRIKFWSLIITEYKKTRWHMTAIHP